MGATVGEPVVVTASAVMPKVLAGSLAICVLSAAAAVALMGVAAALDETKWYKTRYEDALKADMESTCTDAPVKLESTPSR